ncbi:MAG: hypothetical protein RBS07_12555 [Lentimicrobium sp.]|jgi:hypothetical protein|nr:hypothetical protein [Lentimicrobium sp.]
MRIPAFTLLLMTALFFVSCKQDEPLQRASVILKTGVAYTSSNVEVQQGATISIGVIASGGDAALTYIRIERISGSDTTVQLDRGIYKERPGLDEDFSFPKGNAASETWRVLVMNADRDTATATLVVRKAPGFNFGPIHHYSDVVVGMQNNTTSPSYLDADLGQVYDIVTVSGKINTVDMVAYFYYTSGLPSPSLACPGYTSVVGYYPVINNWPEKNTTLFDYNTSDNDLISVEAFDAATNDSLLITGYNPTKVSGNCKYAYAGKVIPFKTQQGKYGLLKIVLADEHEEGTMLMEIKIQQ